MPSQGQSRPGEAGVFGALWMAQEVLEILMADIALTHQPPIRAAQYVRMSTEHQNYSLGHQQEAIAAYAADRGYEVVQTYADAGVSGLSLNRRDGLKRLLKDVLSGEAEFSVILTYDVSRWGRFQDPDQSAHYEFVCKEAGVRIEYCAELFDNDGSLGATLVKHLKRAMAAEYSRELSAKVGAAQRRLADLGFWQGGPPGFGLRRMTVRPDGSAGRTLEPGEWKAIMGDRIVLTLGPDSELALVRRIYRMFVVEGLSRASVSRALNREGLRAESGAAWSPKRIHQVLTNEKYVGCLVFGKTGGHLRTSRARRVRASWNRTEGALPPIVSRETFDLAQRNIAKRCHHMSDADMLKGLSSLLSSHGRLSAVLINDAEHLPCAHVYRYRFGGLIEAFAQVGYTPSRRALRAGAMTRTGLASRRRNWACAMTDEDMIVKLRQLLDQVGRLSVQIINDAAQVPGAELYRRRFGGMASATSRGTLSRAMLDRNVRRMSRICQSFVPEASMISAFSLPSA
jgi:DNA invertase Pin-like site-specific DNA recombinase